MSAAITGGYVALHAGFESLGYDGCRLVAGSGIRFDDRRLADLKGVPGQWRLYSVTSC